jgi:hypothetical protein
MFNIAFIILWVIVFGALAYLILQATRNIREINESKNTYILNTNDISCYPNGDINNLPSVGNKCCVVNGQKTTQRPFTIPYYNLNVIVDTIVTPYADACYGFCTDTDPVSGECKDDLTVQNPYTQCIQALIPVSQTIDGKLFASKSEVSFGNYVDIQGCTTAALPVAQTNNNPYYVVNKRFTPFGLNPDAVDNCPQQADC